MNFEEYIYNTSKTYSFIIGVADDIPDGFDDQLENTLKKYGIISFGAPKKTPIQMKPLDFPQLSNTSATYWEVELHYPTFPEALQSYISQTCDVSINNLIVRTPDMPVQEYQDKKSENTEYTTLLTNAELESVDSQHLVGEDRVMSLLKELEKERNKEKT